MILPGSQPFCLSGGPFGCLLIHSFASSPQELRWLGRQLNQSGFTVLAIRQAGHGTEYVDLRRTRYTDWIASMEDGLRLLEKQCEKRIIIGATLGSALALIAGAKLPVDAIVAISPPYDLDTYAQTVQLDLPSPLLRFLRLGNRSILNPGSLPNLLPKDDTSHLSYPLIPTRTIAEIELLITEMKRVLPRVDVPTLLMHTDAEDDVSSETVTKILNQLGTKRVKIVRIREHGPETSLQLERERITEAITRFVTSQPGFQR